MLVKREEEEEKKWWEEERVKFTSPGATGCIYTILELRQNQFWNHKSQVLLKKVGLLVWDT